MSLGAGPGFDAFHTGSERIRTPSGVEYTCPMGDKDCRDEVMAIDKLATEFDNEYVNRAFGK